MELKLTLAWPKDKPKNIDEKIYALYGEAWLTEKRKERGRTTAKNELTEEDWRDIGCLVLVNQALANRIEEHQGPG